MSALSSTTSTARAPGAAGTSERGARPRRVQPAHRLDQEALGARGGRGRRRPRGTTLLGGQVRRRRTGPSTRERRRPRPGVLVDRRPRRRAARPARPPARARCPCPRRCASARPATRWKRSNSRACSAGSMPMPVSATVSRAAPPPRAERAPSIAALERELQRVREQVQDDLGPHLAVDVDGLGQRRAVDLERQPGALDRRLEHARRARPCSGARSIGAKRALDAAGLAAARSPAAC